MKTQLKFLAICHLLSALCWGAHAQGTAFTYQGRFNTNNSPYSGTAEFQFTLWDAATGGNAVATNNPASIAASVAGGLFTTALDFGSNVFNGQPRFLQIEARTVLGPFIPLSPRQPLTPAPYAIYAGGVSAAGISGTIPASALSGAYSGVVNLSNVNNSFAGNGAGLINLNSTSLGGIAASNYWRLTGNSVATNQFLGSTNNVNLELRANNEPSMRFSYRANTNFGVSPAVIGGYKGNSASFSFLGNTTEYVGATIGGGGYSNTANYVLADLGTVSGGAGNIASGIGSFVGGGRNNLASGNYSAVLGGQDNQATNSRATAMGSGTIAGADGATAMGLSTAALGRYSTAMGFNSTASGETSTAMGYSSDASGYYSTAIGISCTASAISSVAMGTECAAGGTESVAMGFRARALHSGSFVWADAQGTFGPFFDSTADDTFNIRARGGVWLDDTAANPTDLYFGADARQMINLFNQQYGIGVQSSTTYFRSNARFSWFKLGTHSDTQNDPGAGGSVLMTLTSSGLTVNGTFVSASDRNVKEDFKPVDAQAVLEKVVALPLSEWQYKSDEERSRHLGPMAQDFKTAFNLGADDKHIAMVDADGVALAAIQGLNQKLEETRAENVELKKELSEIKALLAKLATAKN